MGSMYFPAGMNSIQNVYYFSRCVLFRAQMINFILSVYYAENVTLDHFSFFSSILRKFDENDSEYDRIGFSQIVYSAF